MRPVREILAGFEALPLAGIGTVLGKRRALVLAPHPDDESLGCGGLIAAACAEGNAPIVAILTDGAASHPGSLSYPPARLRQVREDEVLAATALLGLPARQLHFFAQPDTKLRPDGAIIGALVRLAETQGCGVVIGPWQGDPHCDHEAAASIAEAVASNTGLPLLSYPVWGWLRKAGTLLEEPRAGGWRLDISAFLERKAQAIAAHVSQYGGLIEDSPDGFRLPKNLLRIFARPYEVFISE